MSAPTFSPSLNRVVLAALSGLPSEVAGTRAHEWLASWGVARLMRGRLNFPNLPPVPDAPEVARLTASAAYPPALNSLVEEGNPEALALAGALGVALAALLATLHLAPEDAREARPEWPADHWDRWRGVRRVGVGGGIVRGMLGERMIGAAQEWLPRLGAGEVAVFRAERPHLLPLLGSARSLPDGPAVLIDAGHTSVKRARTVVRNGSVVSLSEAPALPAPLGLTPPDLAAFLTETAADLAPRESPSLRVGLSLAAYLNADGQPFPGQGGLYGPLSTLPLVPTLTAHLEDRLGRPVLVRVGHDGTAAGRALAAQADAAVVLGTSLGGGLNVG